MMPIMKRSFVTILIIRISRLTNSLRFRVNLLAITRAGKGQTVIEPTIDMWTRERRPNNIVVNDPKGELLQKFYVPGTYRGFQIVQFNLINAMNTDIYNRAKRTLCFRKVG